jgi:hypothetical protein
MSAIRVSVEKHTKANSVTVTSRDASTVSSEVQVRQLVAVPAEIETRHLPTNSRLVKSTIGAGALAEKSRTRMSRHPVWVTTASTSGA